MVSSRSFPDAAAPASPSAGGPVQPSAVPPAVPVSAQQANEAIRQYVLGRRSWSRKELAELDRLRGVWREATARRSAPEGGPRPGDRRTANAPRHEVAGSVPFHRAS